MADRQILFSGPMIRALLEGRKTQTRRVLSPQPFADGYFEGEIDCTTVPAEAQFAKCFRFGATAVGGGAVRTELYEPRIQSGDRLWVREAWRTSTAYDDLRPSDMGGEEPVRFEVDGTKIRWSAGTAPTGRTRPGMFMPRWASRLTLVATEVRVQRLQDISEADAIAEGVDSAGDGIAFVQRSDALTYSTPIGCYAALWNDLNAKRGYGWDTNPWVVAVTFTVHRRNIDSLTVQEAA